jgi:hypothetical protein
MANSDLKGKTYEVDPLHHKYLGANISYEALKMRETRMKKAQEAKNVAEFDRYGGNETLKYIQNTLKIDRDGLKSTKKIGMDTGRENQFIRPHEKDRDNANPTAVGGLPKMNKGSINRKIMSNKEVYNESIEAEIGKIRYLIEYMNNKKQKV